MKPTHTAEFSYFHFRSTNKLFSLFFIVHIYLPIQRGLQWKQNEIEMSTLQNRTERFWRKYDCTLNRKWCGDEIWKCLIHREKEECRDLNCTESKGHQIEKTVQKTMEKYWIDVGVDSTLSNDKQKCKFVSAHRKLLKINREFME